MTDDAQAEPYRAPGPRATVLLCDAAQMVGGKLYILGGGWSRVLGLGPLNMALAVYLKVPWHEANRAMPLRIDLVTEDGQPVPAGEGQGGIRVEGQVEVGRPPGLRQGTELDTAFVIPINGMALRPAVYRWNVNIDGQLVETITFEVLVPPQGMVPGTPPSQ